jgi:hypothetical protein
MDRSRDLARQIAVLAATVFMLVAAVVGTGLLGGTPVQDLQDGALDADATYLAPGRQAFSIWSVIYLGLIAYAIWQAFPRQRDTPRQRSLGWLVALTCVLNGVWLVTAQFLTLGLTVLAIVLLLAALGWTFHRAVVTRVASDGAADAILLDGVTGLHLGWVALATVANVTAWLTSIGEPSWESAAEVWGVIVLIVVTALGVAIARVSGWRVTPGLAMGWGLSWIGVARLSDEPSSNLIGSVALIAAATVALPPLLVAVLRFLRPPVD